MKVLLIAPMPPPLGGIARWTETVLGYCEINKELKLHHINTASSCEAITTRSMHERYIEPLFRILKIIKQINDIVKKKNVNVAHLTTSAGYGTIRDIIILKRLKKLNIPSIYHLHFGRLADIKKKKTLEYQLLKKAILLSRVTIVIDQRTKQALNEICSSVFIPNPIEEVPIKYSENKKIIFLGYVVKKKGIEELITAWNRLSENFPDWTLDIVGPGNPRYIEYIQNTYKCKRVAFIGELPHEEAMKRLQEASIFVLPSYSEGLPYSVCEAMFAGKTIVATAVGSISFLLDNDCGIICKEKDSHDLYEALKKGMQDPKLRVQLCFNSSEKARRLLTVDIVIKQYTELWKRTSA